MKAVLRPLFLTFSSFYVSTVLFFISPAIVANDLSKQQQQIQQQIKQQQAKVEEQRKQRDRLQSTLKNQEIAISGVVNQLKQTQLTLSEIRQTIRRTEQEIKKLEQQEQTQKEKLKKQLDSAYRSGIHPSVLERLLSNDAKEADRMMAYYAHINQIRVETIQDLRRTQEELKNQRDTLNEQQSSQTTQLSEQKKQEQSLKQVKSERENTLRTLGRTLARDENRLDELKNNENALRRQIEQATQRAQQQEKQAIENLEKKKATEEKRTNKPYQPTEQEQLAVRRGGGLGSAKSQYRMPVSGKVVSSFGSTQAGEIRWKGVVIQANTGAPVQAIADGKVILSDWLQGYGQVVVIDHGKGDMSLYGYNQSVSVRTGHYVKLGQVIATVGNSGGQSRSGLYFEIRRQGVAVNPLRWVK